MKKLQKLSLVSVFFLVSLGLISQNIDLVPGINYSYNPANEQGIIEIIYVDVCNNGSDDAPAFDVSMYLWDADIQQHYVIATTRLTNGLSGNACVSIENWIININDTPDIPAGVYRLGIWVDSSEEVEETNTQNNAGLLSGNNHYTPSSFVEVSVIRKLEVFPNPATDQLSIEFELTEVNPVSIGLFDVTGKRVIEIADNEISSGINTLNIDISSLCSGIYYLAIQNNSGKLVKKVILK